MAAALVAADITARSDVMAEGDDNRDVAEMGRQFKRNDRPDMFSECADQAGMTFIALRARDSHCICSAEAPKARAPSV